MAKRPLELRIFAQHAVLDPLLQARPCRAVIAAMFRIAGHVELDELAEDQELVGQESMSRNRRRVVRQLLVLLQALVDETDEGAVGPEYMTPAVRIFKPGAGHDPPLVRGAAGSDDPGFPAHDRLALDRAFEATEMDLRAKSGVSVKVGLEPRR